MQKVQKDLQKAKKWLLIPLYWFSFEICFDACWTCKSNFTRSIGATAVFETAALIPPAKKSLANDIGSLAFFAGAGFATSPILDFFSFFSLLLNRGN